MEKLSARAYGRDARITVAVFIAIAALAFLPACRRREPGPPPQAETAPVFVSAKDASWPIFRGDPQLTGCSEVTLPDTLALLWSFRTGDEVRSSPVIGSGRVFIGSYDGKVYALSLAKGEEIWAFDTGDAVEAPPLFLDGTVYVGSLDGVFHALDAESGEKRWEARTDGKIVGSANWVALPGREGNRILLGSHDSILRCFNAATGEVLWSFEAQSYINGAPAVYGDKVVFGGCDSNVYVISAKNGKPIASVEAGSYVPASVSVAGDRAYLCHYDNEILCVDLREKTIVWRYGDEKEGSPFFSSPAVCPDRVVAGSQDEKVHCVRRSDGEGLWKFSTLGNVDSSPVVCDDKVVVGSDDGRLYLLRLEDGAKLWSFEVGESISGSAAVVPGLVVVGAADGRIYAFRNN
jgi:outer membrane protein assembly factor BamB